MYKLIISIVFVLVVSSQLFAQEYEYVPFPDSGAVWSEMYTSEETMDVYENFALSGKDTIINDIYYKKLYIFYDKTFDKNQAKCIGGIREDENKRIYSKGDTVIHNDKPFWLAEPPLDEMLLYDFSLEIGDTIKNGNSHDEIVVMDIDTILFGNTLRKVFKLSHHVEWIEGIGNTRGLLYSSGDIAIGGSNGYLICFIQNDSVLYHNDYYDNCFPPLLNIDNIYSNIDITVFSKREEKLICFKWRNCKINRIELFNVQGVLIDVINLSNNSIEANYPTNRMQSGVYIYRANNSNGYVQSGRFVVQ